ncbi:hypothetical protein [Streptomyces sp. NPDC058953]|uniref:hypothetical protein n=1 Tax=unclassified Streptomyces TaxID=2593676 RepID=UPI00367E2996
MESVFRNRLALPGLAIAALALPFGAVQSANAAQTGTTGTVAQTGPNCTERVETGAVTCYATFREAIRHATGGAVTDAPLDARTAMADPTFAKRLNAQVNADGTPAPGITTVPIAVYYDREDHKSPPALIHYASRGCDNDNGVEHAIRDLGVTFRSWNDRISSFRGFSKCQINLYEHRNFKGKQTGYRDSMKRLGNMNNKASSMRLR